MRSTIGINKINIINSAVYISGISKVIQQERRMNRVNHDADSTSSTLSSIAIKNIVERLKSQGRCSSTRKNYDTVWNLFNKFYIRLDSKPDNWEDRIVLFTGYLIENDKKSSTVKSYISAIKAVLQEDRVEINLNHCLISSLTKACKYQNDFVRTRLPI